MDDDYSTDLLLASLLSDNNDEDCNTNTQQVSNIQSLKTSCGSVQQTATAKPASDDKTSQFDSLEDLLNATLSPSEESYSDLEKTASSENASLVNISSSTVSTTTPEVVSKSSTATVGLPPKFRNTFKPVEFSDSGITPELQETTFKSPSYVASSQASTSSINSNNVLTDSRPTTASENAWQQHKSKTTNDLVYPPSKRLCLEDHTSSYTKSIPSVTAITTTTSINPTTSLSGNNVYSNTLARTESNVKTQQLASHPLTTLASLNGVNCATNSNTATNASSSAIDLKRLQETNLVSELQAASTKPISSASILHAIQVVQLNYSMLLQKLSQNIDDATAQEVKAKLMVLTHHYKQLAQQYQAKLSAEKTTQSSNVSTTSTRVVTNTTSSIGSTATVTGYNQSTVSNTLMPSAPFSSAVIDLTHDKSTKTTTTATGKESSGIVTAPAAVQNLANTTVATAAMAGTNVSSYLQSIPSLAAYLLQNTEAQKQLTPMELQQLNQIRVNLLQEFQRRQVQNFLTSLPPDTRPKNVNELKGMMKEKNFSIQIPPFLVAPVMKPSAPLNPTQYKQEIKTDPLITTGHATDNKQMAMQAASLSGQQQSVMATLLPHTMVNSMKSEEQPTYQHDVKPSGLPVDIKPLVVTTQPQLFIGDMLQHLHNSQIAAGTAKLTTPTISSLLKSDIKREETLTSSTATNQVVQGGTAVTQPNNNLLKNNTHRSYPNTVTPPQYNRSKIMAHNITRNIPGTSFSSKAAKYRAMANVSSSSSVADVSLSMLSSAKPSLHQSSSNSLTYSSTVSSSSSSTHYNTRAQLRTQRMIEEQKRLEEERIKQLTYTPEQLKTISNIKYFMQADHSRVTKVDTQTPFHSKQDAFQRLSAYHVYYEPEPSDAIESRVEQMHDILARELMKKSRGLMAKYNQLLLKHEQKQVPKHIELTNERLFVEGELYKEQQQKDDCTVVQKSTDVTPVSDTITLSKLSSMNSQLIHDINVLHYTNTAGSVGIT